MIQKFNTSNSGASSPGKLFGGPSTQSQSVEEFHVAEAQATHIEETSISLSSSEEMEWEEAAAGGVASQSPSIEKTTPVRPETPRESSESHRQRRRSKILAGPQAPIPRRRSSVPVRRNGQDLISFHRQSCRLFQSLEGTLALNQDWANDAKQPHTGYGSVCRTRPSSQCILKTDNGFAYLTSASSIPLFGSPGNSRRHSSFATPPQPLHGGLPFPSGPTTSSSFSSLTGKSSSVLVEKSTSPLACPPARPQPVSIISWTSAESRRSEYQKIDRSHSGIRGFWRRFTPRWCHGKHVRNGFFNPRNGVGDVESIRRYRLAFDDDNDNDDDDDKSQGHIGREKKTNKNQSRRRIRERKWKWNCLNLLR